MFLRKRNKKPYMFPKKRKRKSFTVGATILALACILLYCMYGEMCIPYQWLPKQAKDFLESNFPKDRCLCAERKHDDALIEYEVQLVGGTKLEFTSSGEWKKIDCGYSFVPSGIVPQTISSDVKSRCPNGHICKIERAHGGYKVKAGSGPELIYAADGTFIRTDT